MHKRPIISPRTDYYFPQSEFSRLSEMAILGDAKAINEITYLYERGCLGPRA